MTVDVTLDTYAFVAEGNAEGTTPTSPNFRSFECVSYNFAPDTKMISSQIMRTNGAAVHAGKGQVTVTGEIKTELRRDSAMELLMASALGGTWTANVLKANSADMSYTFEHARKNGNNVTYYRSVGCTPNKFAFAVKEGTYSELTIGFMGTSVATAGGLVANATYIAPTGVGNPLDGNDVGTINVGGITATYESLEFTLDQGRDARFGLSGSPFALSTGASGNRELKGKVRFYRDGLGPDATFSTDTPFPISITMGSVTGNILTFLMNSCVAAYPVQTNEGGNPFVDVEFIAYNDAVLGTDLQITRG